MFGERLKMAKKIVANFNVIAMISAFAVGDKVNLHVRSYPSATSLYRAAIVVYQLRCTVHFYLSSSVGGQSAPQ